MSVRAYRDQDDDPLSQRLAAAFLISLLAHSAFFGIVQIGNQLKWWDASPFSVFRKVRLSPEDLAQLREAESRPVEKPEAQDLVYVQVVDPTGEPPVNTPFYSAESSRASNPDPGTLNAPRIEGQQTKVLRTEDVPRSQAGAAPSAPPQPTPAPPEPRRETAATPAPQPEQVLPIEAPSLIEKAVEPERAPGIGDLAMLRPEVRPPPTPAPRTPDVEPRVPVPEPVDAPETPKATPRTRPRTVAEARLRQELLSGEKIRQDGGVPTKGPVRLDVQGKSFGSYDEVLVMAVQNRWFQLLEQVRFAGGTTGRVVINFRLFADGTVSIVEPTESEVDAFLESLCVRAVRDPSPYAEWPQAMVREIGRKFREIRFTFYYD